MRFPLAPGFRRCAPVIRGHTPSSGNMREAQRFRIARVMFPQRLPIGAPLRGCQDKRPSRCFRCARAFSARVRTDRRVRRSAGPPDHGPQGHSGGAAPRPTGRARREGRPFVGAQNFVPLQRGTPNPHLLMKQSKTIYFANSVNLVSLIIVTFIWPGYSISSWIFVAIWRASSSDWASEICSGSTMHRISRPA